MAPSVRSDTTAEMCGLNAWIKLDELCYPVILASHFLFRFHEDLLMVQHQCMDIILLFCTSQHSARTVYVLTMKNHVCKWHDT